MKNLLSFCLLLAIVSWARADVRREGEAWVLEDSQLKVTVGAGNALDTLTGKRKQPVPLAGDTRSSLRIGGRYRTIYFELVR